MDSTPSRMAYFSTKGGKWPPRPAPGTSSRFIIRGDQLDRDVCDAFVEGLRKEFPEKCKELRDVLGDPQDIYEYFDDFDISIHGLDYLNTVINQIVWQNVSRIRDLEKFIEDWKTKNRKQFWDLSPESTITEVFDAKILETNDATWLSDALERLWLRRDCYSAQKDRTNFHSDPEQWVSDEVNKSSSSELPQSFPHTVVARPIEDNPSSQIQHRVPVPLASRVPFPVPPQPRPRKRPAPMTVSNDARVLERLEANQAPFPPYNAAPPLPVIPEYPFDPFIRQLPLPDPVRIDQNGGPTEPFQPPSGDPVSNLKSSLQEAFGVSPVTAPPITHNVPVQPFNEQPQALSMATPKTHELSAQRFNEQSDVPLTANSKPRESPVQSYRERSEALSTAAPNDYGLPVLPSREESRILSEPQQPPPRRQNGNIQQTKIAQPQKKRRKDDEWYDVPRPVYVGPNVQPHQLPGNPMPAARLGLGAPPGLGLQPRVFMSGPTVQASQQQAGRDRRGSVNYRETPQTPRRGSLKNTYSDNEPSEKLWVGNLTDKDSAEALVPLFGPLGGMRISPLKRSNINDNNAWFTFVTFQTVAQASNALSIAGQQNFAGRRLAVRYAYSRAVDPRVPTQPDDWQYMGPSSHPPLFKPEKQRGAEMTNRPRDQIHPFNSSRGPTVASSGPAAGTEFRSIPAGAATQPPKPTNLAASEVLPLRHGLAENRKPEAYLQGTQGSANQGGLAQVSNPQIQHGSQSMNLYAGASHKVVTEPSAAIMTISEPVLEQRSSQVPASVIQIGPEPKIQPPYAPSAQIPECQSPQPKIDQPLTRKDNEPTTVMSSMPTDRAGEDPMVGSSQPRNQESPSKGARGRRKAQNKAKGKAKLISEAEHQVPSEPQFSKVIDDNVGMTNDATQEVIAGRQIPGQAAAADSVARKQPQSKSKGAKKRHIGGQDGRGIDGVATKGVGSTAAFLKPIDGTEKDDRKSDSDMTATEGVIYEEMARKESSSSQEALPTPALENSTQPTTYATSEVSDTNMRPLPDSQPRLKKQQRGGQYKEKGKEGTNLSQEDQGASENADAGGSPVLTVVELPQGSKVSQSTQRPPRSMRSITIPAIPDFSRLQQLHRHEKRLQEIQHRLEDVGAAADSNGSDSVGNTLEGSASPERLTEETRITEINEPTVSTGRSEVTPTTASSTTIEGELDVTIAASKDESPVSTREDTSSDKGTSSISVAPTRQPSKSPRIDESQAGPGIQIEEKQNEIVGSAEKSTTGTNPNVQIVEEVAAAATLASLASQQEKIQEIDTVSGPLLAEHDILSAKEEESAPAIDPSLASQHISPDKADGVDSAAGSDPDEGQHVLIPDAPTLTGSAKKKKKRKPKKSKAKANSSTQQQQEVEALPAPGTTSAEKGGPMNETNMPAPEMPYQTDAEQPSTSTKAQEKVREEIPEIHPVQINPHFYSFQPEQFSAGVADYYKEKKSLYLKEMPYDIDITEPSRSPDESNPQSQEEPTRTYSPGTHQRAMEDAMKDGGYIIDSSEEEYMLDDDELGQENGGPRVNLRNLKRLLHVSKTAVAKEQGNQERAAILNHLPPSVVEDYIDGSFEHNGPKFHALDKDVQSSVKRLMQLDKHVAVLRATLKQNEDYAPEGQSSSALFTEGAQSGPLKVSSSIYQQAVSNIKRELTVGLDATTRQARLREFDEKQKAMEARYAAEEAERKTKSGEPSKKSTLNASELTAAGLLAGASKWSQVFEERREKKRPEIAHHAMGAIEPISIPPSGSPAQRAKIKHGDGSEEIILIAPNYRDETPTTGDHEATPQLSPISTLFPPLPPAPLAAHEIPWQWPGEPTPNVILDEVLYTQLPNTPDRYQAAFKIQPNDGFVTNPNESCIEIVRRNNVNVWIREGFGTDVMAEDIQSTGTTSRRYITMQELKRYSQTGDTSDELDWVEEERLQEDREARAQEKREERAKKGKRTELERLHTVEIDKTRGAVERIEPRLETYLPEEERGKSTKRRVGDLLWGVPLGEQAWGVGREDLAERGALYE